jgi:UDP-GlcNAc3NAcA epimerase
MKKIISIIGARPQFIKHAPMQIELQKYYSSITIHTGQHFDHNMSQVFFDELNIAKPDYLLNAGAGKPHGEQTGLMMIEIEQICSKDRPDAILLYGDTNSTLAGALVAAKLNIQQFHIEAGLRSFNREMPEEINRIVADEFAHLLFCPSDQAIKNLSLEGINHSRIFKTGDVMCDMIRLIEKNLNPPFDFPYYLVTIHRPYNTDDPGRLMMILSVLNRLDKKVVFSIHPRTMNALIASGVDPLDFNNINFISPTGYIESISLQKFSECVITDSGGIQKEAYILKKKCITIRKETEWIETLQGSWNTLVFENLEDIFSIIKQDAFDHVGDLYGSGYAASEITSIIREYL